MGPGVYFALCFLGCLAFSHAEEGAKDRLLPRPRAPCRPGAMYYKNMCYEYLSTTVTWQEAENLCWNERWGNLASFQTKQDEKAISNYIKKAGGSNVVWIGFHAELISSKYEWGWSDGLEYLDGSALWDGRRPGSPSSNTCFALSNVKYPTASERWEKFNCGFQYPYLCKYYPADARSLMGRRQ